MRREDENQFSVVLSCGVRFSVFGIRRSAIRWGHFGIGFAKS